MTIRPRASRRLLAAATAGVLALAAHAAGLAAQNAPATPADSVLALEEARRQAVVRGDTVALSGMVAPEFTEISRLGTLRSRADNLREIASGVLKFTSVTHDSLTVRLYGDVAVLQGIAENAGTYRGFPFRGKVRYTRVFVRRDGRWQAVTMQQTLMQ